MFAYIILSIYVRLYHPLHLCSLHHPRYLLHLCSLHHPIIGHSTTPLPFTRILYTILSISIIYVRLYHSLYLHHLCSLVPPIIGHSTTPLPFTRILYTILSISIIYVRLYHSLYLHHLCSLVPSSYLSLSITNTATVAPVIDVKKCNPDTLPNSIRKRL